MHLNRHFCGQRSSHKWTLYRATKAVQNLSHRIHFQNTYFSTGNDSLTKGSLGLIRHNALLKHCPIIKKHFSYSCWHFIQCLFFSFGCHCTWHLLSVGEKVAKNPENMSKLRKGPHCLDLCVCPTLSAWALLPGSAGSRGHGPRRAPPECDYRLPRWCFFPVAPSIHSLKPCCPGAPSALSLMLSKGT